MKICCLSDQHGYLDFDLPEADIYLHAGDICPDFGPGTYSGTKQQEVWLRQEWQPWLLNQRAIRHLNRVYVTPGNHDFVWRHASAYFVVDDLMDIDGLKVWLSPWSNTFGGWAWMKNPADLVPIYEAIPEGTDIIVSHQPPYGYGDRVPDRYIVFQADGDPHVGSKELLATIDRVKPKAVICGHIHDGRGSYKYGDTDIYNVALVNEAYDRVNDPVVIEIGGF